MALKDLFISKDKRKEQLRQQREKALRAAEEAAKSTDITITEMQAERDKLWQQAKSYKKDGQQLAVQRTLKSYRAMEAHISTIEMKRWGFEQIITRIRLAETDQAFTSALEGLVAIQTADPQSLENTFERLGMQMENVEDSNKIWKSMYDEEMNKVETTVGEELPSIAEMDSLLDDEVLVEHDKPSVIAATPKETAAEDISQMISKAEQDEFDKKIGIGQARLKKIPGEA